MCADLVQMYRQISKFDPKKFSREKTDTVILQIIAVFFKLQSWFVSATKS